MQELITLKLRPISEHISSASFPITRSAHPWETDRISDSVRHAICPDNPPKNSSTNLKRLSDKPVVPVKHPRRVSSMPKIYPLFQTQAPLAPYSRKDWELAVEDVKLSYVKKQYKLCAERCVNILENPRGPIHHLHSLYFSFYAATCLELQAIPLHTKSSAKLPLLKHAKAYYEIAASYISYAEAACNSPTPPSLYESRSRSLSSASSTSSTDSVTFHSSPYSSPATSVYDSDDLGDDLHHTKLNKRGSLKPQPLILPPKKKVSFETSLPSINSNGHMIFTSDVDSEECCFPLPPTLGDFIPRKMSSYNRSSPPGPPPPMPLPALPPKSRRRSQQPISPPSPISALSPRNRRRSRQILSLPISFSNPVEPEIVATTPAIIRYQSQLLTFKPQISYHLTKLSKLIHDTTTASFKPDVRFGDAIDEILESPVLGLYLGDCESLSSSPYQYSNFPGQSDGWEQHGDDSGGLNAEDIKNYPMYVDDHADEFADDNERRKNYMCSKEKRRRIEAGRSRMWMRERFDGGRYERLCERALMEL